MNLNLIIKASLKSRKAYAGMFCSFVVLSFVLIFLAIGIVFPLGQNISTKINNHILKREIVVNFPETFSSEYIENCLSEIKGISHVEDIYEKPFEISVNEQSGILYGQYNLSYVHKYHTLEITDGRAFAESESGVMLVPHSFVDFNVSAGIMTPIDGTQLIGKTLDICDRTETVSNYLVVGTYDTTDPMFKGKEFLIPQRDLLGINRNQIDYFPDIYSDDYSYVAVTDSSKSRDSVLSEIEEIAHCYSQPFNVDTETYNTAFIVLLLVNVLFIFLTVFGFYMFLKNNINIRTSEIALYRAIGFNSKKLFRVILGEYLTLTLCSLAVGVGAFGLVAHFVVNPYLNSLFGNTFMAMTVSTNPLMAVAIIAGYVTVTLLICKTAVKRSERIDLTILLRK